MVPRWQTSTCSSSAQISISLSSYLPMAPTSLTFTFRLFSASLWLVVLLVVAISNHFHSLCLPLPLVISQPVAPLTEASGLARAHAISRTDAAQYLIGCRAERCPHIRAETGGAAIKEGGGEDNKVCDIVDCLSECWDHCFSDCLLPAVCCHRNKSKKQQM